MLEIMTILKYFDLNILLEKKYLYKSNM